MLRASETSAAAMAARRPAAPPPTMTMSCEIVSIRLAPAGGSPSILPLHGYVRAQLHRLVLEAHGLVGLPVGQGVAEPVLVVPEGMVLSVVPAPALVPGQGSGHQGLRAV